jgi:hypothetical protein
VSGALITGNVRARSASRPRALLSRIRTKTMTSQDVHAMPIPPGPSSRNDSEESVSEPIAWRPSCRSTAAMAFPAIQQVRIELKFVGRNANSPGSQPSSTRFTA